MKEGARLETLRIAAFGGALSLSVVVAFAPGTWETMVVRSFLPQWLLLLGGSALWLLFRRRWRDGALTACGALLLMPQFDPPVAVGPSVAWPALRMAHLNVLQSNDAYPAVIDRILALDADVISIQEVDHDWSLALREGLSSAYPFQVVEPRSNCYGIALFSRVPLDNARAVFLGAAPAVQAGLRIGGRRATLIAVHASSPGSPRHFSARNEQLLELAERVSVSPDPVVIIGDLNATPWDRDLQAFLRITSLRTHASAWAPTFPSFAHLALIPIDHVLTSSSFDVVAQRTLHVPGSDHRGLVADLAPAP